MSAVITGNWNLDDLQENVDICEDDNSVTKVRDHIVIQISTQVLASTVPNRLDIGSLQAAITYHVGGITRTNNPAGTGKFICVGDGIAPIEKPGEYVYRRQTWEYYGPWRNAPAEWNV